MGKIVRLKRLDRCDEKNTMYRYVFGNNSNLLTRKKRRR